MPPNQPHRQGWLWLLIGAIGVTGLVIALTGRFPGVLDDEDNVGRLVYLLGWLVLAGSGLWLGIRQRPARALQHAAIWIAAGCGSAAPRTCRRCSG